MKQLVLPPLTCPFEPEPLEALRARYAAALTPAFRPIDIERADASPWWERRCVFDCEDGFRVAVCAYTDVPSFGLSYVALLLGLQVPPDSGGKPTVVRVSGTIGPDYLPAFRDRERIARVLGHRAAMVHERESIATHFTEIAGVSRKELVFVGWCLDDLRPVWQLEVHDPHAVTPQVD